MCVYLSPSYHDLVSSVFTDSEGTDPPEEEGLSGGAIAGIVIGSLIGIGFLGTVIHFWIEGEKKKKAAAARQAVARQPTTQQPTPSLPAPAQQPPVAIHSSLINIPPLNLSPPPSQPPAVASTFTPATVDPPSQSAAELVAPPPPSYQVSHSRALSPYQVHC